MNAADRKSPTPFSGWWLSPTPLKNMSSSQKRDDSSQDMEKPNSCSKLTTNQYIGLLRHGQQHQGCTADLEIGSEHASLIRFPRSSRISARSDMTSIGSPCAHAHMSTPRLRRTLGENTSMKKNYGIACRTKWAKKTCSKAQPDELCLTLCFSVTHEL